MPNFADYISDNKSGIWRYERLLGKNGQLNLESNLTPLEKAEDLGKILGVENLYFKREDKNVFGSFKSRSLAYQVSYYKNLGAKALVISSSGNAAICAAKYCDLAGIKLICFVSPHTDPGKKAVLAETNAIIIQTDRAIRFASYVAAKYKMPNLRPSIDDNSLLGFETLAYEMFEQNGQLLNKLAIFTFVTSGSSFVGMYNGFKKLVNLGFLTQVPRMFAVQAGDSKSLLEFNLEGFSIDSNGGEKKYGAGKLGIKDTKRKDDIIKIIQETDGEILYINEEEIADINRHCLDICGQVSEEGLAVLAAVSKEKCSNVIVIMSGKNWGSDSQQKREFLKAESFEEVDNIVIPAEAGIHV